MLVRIVELTKVKRVEHLEVFSEQLCTHTIADRWPSLIQRGEIYKIRVLRLTVHSIIISSKSRSRAQPQVGNESLVQLPASQTHRIQIVWIHVWGNDCP